MTPPSAAYLVGLLARAMAVQLDELARAGPATPDGWWFTSAASISTEPDPAAVETGTPS